MFIPILRYIKCKGNPLASWKDSSFWCHAELEPHQTPRTVAPSTSPCNFHYVSCLSFSTRLNSRLQQCKWTLTRLAEKTQLQAARWSDLARLQCARIIAIPSIPSTNINKWCFMILRWLWCPFGRLWESRFTLLSPVIQGRDWQQVFQQSSQLPNTWAQKSEDVSFDILQLALCNLLFDLGDAISIPLPLVTIWSTLIESSRSQDIGKKEKHLRSQTNDPTGKTKSMNICESKIVHDEDLHKCRKNCCFAEEKKKGWRFGWSLQEITSTFLFWCCFNLDRDVPLTWEMIVVSSTSLAVFQSSSRGSTSIDNNVITLKTS